MDRVLSVRSLLGAVTGLVLVSGCADAPTSTSSRSTPTPAPSAFVVLTGLDWSTTSTRALKPAWTAGPCEGGGRAPLRCVRHNGQLVAQLEFLTYPTKTITHHGNDPVEIAHAVARSSYRSFRADRLAGCGSDASVDPLMTVEQQVVGRPGVRYEFRLHRHGRVDEQVVGWATVAGDTLNLIVTAAYAADACLPPKGPSTDVGVLDDARPVLDAAVAGATPPRSGT